MYPKALIFLSPFSALHEAPFSHAFSNSDPPPPNPILESGKLQSPPWSAMISIRTPEVIWLREKPIENFSRMCFFFPFFQARSYNSVEKVDTWCFPFFLSFLFCINNFFLQKHFCEFATLSRHTHKFSDCSLQERDCSPEETMRTTCCDVNR